MDIKDLFINQEPIQGFIPFKNVWFKNKTMKVAFSGSSGSGKTTLVKFVEQEFGLRHISGSSGDLLNVEDKQMLQEMYGFYGGKGHLGVIQHSAMNAHYGIDNQVMVLNRRRELIFQNDNFVTDRSPVDNLTYFISQVGFHKEANDLMVEDFALKCLEAFYCLTHLIYVKAVQPYGVEYNGSRIANKWWQRASDAQFDYWLNDFFLSRKASALGVELNPPKILIIDFWNLKERMGIIREFLKEDSQTKLF